MGTPSRTDPPRRRLHLLLAGLALSPVFCLPVSGRSQGLVQATTVPLLLPGGLAYDAQGNLYFAETANHLIRKVSPSGILTIVAGTGVQGFAGDGAPAIAALLDSPTAVALDAAGDIFLADTHNHRIRRVDAVSGIITTIAGTGTPANSPDGTPAASAQINLPGALAFDSAGDLYFADSASFVIRRIAAGTGLLTTVAGDGVQGFSGDGAPATSASIDSPLGISLDPSGNLYLADSHNQRVRRVDEQTGIITTVAGTGLSGFSGDSSAATAARLDLPRGLALDLSGNLYVVDSLNQRIRRIDALTGQISTIAGDGTQAYAGDGGPAVAASLDTPRAVTISAAGLPTLSDTGNARIRQVDSAANIHTIAGLGTTDPGTLTLSANAVILYGTGSVTASLVASPATGSVTFFDSPGTAAQSVMIGTVALTENSASHPTTTLAARRHYLSATYTGDTTHSPAASGTLALTIAPAPATAAPASSSVLYGLPIPTLGGTLTGILAQDSSAVTVSFATAAAQLSQAGTYPITASLSGLAATNYLLTTNTAAVTITKAPTIATLPASLTAHVASTTAGAPTGSISLLDGTAVYATATISASGDAAFSSTNLTSGTHTLTAAYPGDTNFLASSSAPLLVTIGGASSSDFTLAAASSSSVTIASGSAATFSFAVTPVSGALSSPILLTASGLPIGATASFNPAYLPPGSAPASFVLTIQTAQAASLRTRPSPFWLAVLIPFALLRRRRRTIALLSLAVFALGCGNRVNEAAIFSSAPQSYNITVIATATTSAGATLQHTAGVTLTLQ
jgi:sugar lactone lactonase YvrE